MKNTSAILASLVAAFLAVGANAVEDIKDTKKAIEEKKEEIKDKKKDIEEKKEEIKDKKEEIKKAEEKK